MITYEVRFGEAVRPFAQYRVNAMHYARRVSRRLGYVAHLVAFDGDEEIGRIMYENGFRCSVEGDV